MPSDERFSIVESFDDAVVVIDAHRVVVAANSAMERWTGCDRVAAVGRVVDDLLATLPPDLWTHPIVLALAGERGRGPATVIDVAGVPAWLEPQWAPRTDAPGAVLTLRNVTAERQRALFVRALETVGRSLTSSLEPDQVLDTIASTARDIMSADSAIVVAWDERAERLTVLRAVGRLSRDFAPGSVPLGGAPVSVAAREARTVATSDVLADPRFTLDTVRRRQIAREGFKAVAAAPLIAKGVVRGALAVHQWTKRTFTEDELVVLTLLAEQGALAMENARLYAEARRSADRLRELTELEQMVAASLDPDAVLRAIAAAAARLVGADVVQVWTADHATRQLRLRASSATAAEPPLRETIELGEGVMGRAVAEKRTIYVPDGLLVAPMLQGDDVLGVLTVHAGSESIASDEDRALITTLAAHAGGALRNAAFYQTEQVQTERIRALAAVNQRISSTLDVPSLLRTIADSAVQLTDTAFASFWIADDRTRTLVWTGQAYSEIARDYPRKTVSYDDGTAGWIARHREPLVIDDVSVDPRIFVPDWWRRWGFTSFAGYPVMADGELLAILLLCHTQPVTLSTATRDTLDIFLAQAASAVRNARLYAESQRERREATALADTARSLALSLDFDEVADRIVEAVIPVFNAHSSSLYRISGDGEITAVARGGAGRASFDQRLTWPKGTGVVGRCVEARRPVWTSDVFAEPAYELPPALREAIIAMGARAVLATPLNVKSRIVGALVISYAEPREFGEREVALQQAFSDQAALALENAHLYANARDNVERLRDTQAQLVQAAKLGALGQLVSGVAHELNNPLSVIIGYGQLLLSRELPAPFRRPVELMVAQGDRMAKIVRNLLFFARQRPPERGSVRLHDLVEQTLALRLNQMALSSISVRREYDESLPEIGADASQLQQVFLNLLLNAEQAILGADRPGEIIVRTTRGATPDMVCAQVIDDGPGIPADTIGRVFEPFYTTKEVGQGTGLGLSVSYGIVNEHGGRLTVESRPGATTFTVELPARTATPRSAIVMPSAPPMAAQGRPALVVEDEPAVLDLVVTLLTETGWRVDVAAGGKTGLERVQARAYDLVVSDMRMPDGGGDEFYKKAVEHDARLAKRFLFITGDTANPSAWRFLQDAKVAVLEKPFAASAFLDAVRAIALTATPSPA